MVTTGVVGGLPLLGVLVTAADSVHDARASPTLDRRVREHTALVEDVPGSIPATLRNLLTEEVDALVAVEVGAHVWVTALLGAPASSSWRWVPSPGSSRNSSPSHRSR